MPVIPALLSKAIKHGLNFKHIVKAQWLSASSDLSRCLSSLLTWGLTCQIKPQSLAWAVLGKWENTKPILYSGCANAKDRVSISSRVPNTTKDTHCCKGFPAPRQTGLTTQLDQRGGNPKSRCVPRNTADGPTGHRHKTPPSASRSLHNSRQAWRRGEGELEAAWDNVQIFRSLNQLADCWHSRPAAVGIKPSRSQWDTPEGQK